MRFSTDFHFPPPLNPWTTGDLTRTFSANRILSLPSLLPSEIVRLFDIFNGLPSFHPKWSLSLILRLLLVQSIIVAFRYYTTEYLRVSLLLPPPFYSLNGSRMSLGVAPLDFRCNDPVCSTEPLRGVCIPDGVEVPLAVRLDGERDSISFTSRTNYLN